MITDPGYVRIGWKKTDSNLNISDLNLHCKKCKNDRPQRAHHCKICKKCTLKMDHHCPWIANCVGLKNQKYFYQFLFFATLGDLIGSIILIKTLIKLASNGIFNLNDKKINSVSDIILSFWSETMIAFSGLIAFSMTLSIGLLLYFQTKLILNNSTSIECKIDSNLSKTPWYYNNKFHNFKIVMGQTVFEWFLPIFIICV
jgi:hypothetical protein